MVPISSIKFSSQGKERYFLTLNLPSLLTQHQFWQKSTNYHQYLSNVSIVSRNINKFKNYSQWLYILFWSCYKCITLIFYFYYLKFKTTALHMYKIGFNLILLVLSHICNSFFYAFRLKVSLFHNYFIKCHINHNSDMIVLIQLTEGTSVFFTNELLIGNKFQKPRILHFNIKYQ